MQWYYIPWSKLFLYLADRNISSMGIKEKIGKKHAKRLNWNAKERNGDGRSPVRYRASHTHETPVSSVPVSFFMASFGWLLNLLWVLLQGWEALSGKGQAVRCSDFARIMMSVGNIHFCPWRTKWDRDNRQTSMPSPSNNIHLAQT